MDFYSTSFKLSLTLQSAVQFPLPNRVGRWKNCNKFSDHFTLMR